MAFPQVAAYNTSSLTSSGTTHTVNLPSGISSGDLLLIFFATDGDNTVTNWNGYTPIFERDDGSQVFLGIAYRIATGGEGSTVVLTTSQSETSAHVTFRITGHSDSNFPIASTGQYSNSSTPDPDSLTVPGDPREYLWIAVAGNDDRDATTGYPLPDNNRTSIADVNGGCNIGVCTDELNQSTLDPGTFTIAAGEQWMACTVAVYPSTPQTYQGAIVDGAKLGDSKTAVHKISADIVDGVKLGELVTATKYAGQVNETLYPATQETEVTLYGDPVTEVILGQTQQLELGISLYNPLVISVPPLEIPPLLLAGIAFKNIAATKVSITMEQTAQRETQVTLYDPTVITPFEGLITEGAKLGDTLDVSGVLYRSNTEGSRFGDIVDATIIEQGTTYQEDIVEGTKLGEVLDGDIKITIPADIIDGLKLGENVANIHHIISSIVDGIKTGETLSVDAKFYPSLVDGIRLGEIIGIDVSGQISASIVDGVKLGEDISAFGQFYSDVVEGIKTGEIASANILGKIEADVVEGIKLDSVVTSELEQLLEGDIVDGILFGDNSLGIESGGYFIIDGEDTFGPLWEWDVITESSGNGFDRVIDATRRGTFGYKASYGGSAALAYGRKNFTDKTEIYLRGYLYLPVGFSGTANQQVLLFGLYDGTSQLIAFGTETDGSGNAFRWSYSLLGAGWSTKNFSLGAWHRIDIHWKAGTGANGGGQIWIDGDSIVSLFTLNHSAYQADNFRCGTVSTAFIPDNGEYVYFDDIKADSSFIGPYNRSFPFPRAEMTAYPSALEGLKLGDASYRYISELFSIADGVKFGEDKSVTLTIRTVTTDGVKIGENVDAIAQFISALTDGVKFGDAFLDLTRKKVVITFDSEKATITFAAETPSVTFAAESVDMRFRVGVRGEMS